RSAPGPPRPLPTLPGSGGTYVPARRLAVRTGPPRITDTTREKFRVTPLPHSCRRYRFVSLACGQLTAICQVVRPSCFLGARGAIGTGGRSGGVDLPQQTALDVEDETTHVAGVQQERRGPHPLHRLPDVLVDVPEGLHGPGRALADLHLQVVPELLGDGLQTAVRVVDQHHAARTQSALADGQRADHVVRDDPAGVADGVAVAEFEAECRVHVQTG